MADTTNDTRPVDRDYLDARLDTIKAEIAASEDRTGRRLAELESRLDHRLVTVLVGFLGPTMVAVLATLIAVIVK